MEINIEVKETKLLKFLNFVKNYGFTNVHSKVVDVIEFDDNDKLKT